MGRVLRLSAVLLTVLMLSSCATSQASKDLSVLSFNLGNAYALQQETSSAEEAYRNAAAYDPGNIDAVYNLILLLVENGEYAKAYDELLPLLEKQPVRKDLLEMKAYILYQMYLPESALLVYEQLLDNEEDERMRLDCARIAMDLGQYERAQGHLAVLYEASTFSGELMFLFGEIDRLTGLSDPMSWYKTAVLTEPGYRPALEKLTAYADSTNSEGVKEELIRVMEDAVEEHPGDADVQYLLGKRMLLSGNSEGIDHVRESLRSGYTDTDGVRELLSSLEDADLSDSFARMLEQEGLIYIYRTQAAP